MPFSGVNHFGFMIVSPRPKIPGLNARVLSRLTNLYQSYVDIALALEEVPWEVARACRALQSEGWVEEATGSLRGNYRLIKKQS